MIYLLVLIYCVLIVLSGFFSFLCSYPISLYASILRELIFIVIIFMGFCQITIKKIPVYKVNVLILSFFVILFLYSFFIIEKSHLLYAFILYISGPWLFFSITQLINGRKVVKLNKLILLFIFWFVVFNLLIYPFQNALLILSHDIEQTTINNHLFRAGKIRFFGLTFMPTIMGFFCIVLICFSFCYKRWLVLFIIGCVGLYLTGVRLFFPGLFISSFLLQTKKNRFYLSFIYLFIASIVAVIFLQSDDPSLIRHFEDLFFYGPIIVFENFLGVGLGNIGAFNERILISLESDIYLYFIQFGIWGGCLYLLIFYKIYILYANHYIKNNLIIKISKVLLITYLLGSFLLPLSLHRAMSNLFWIMQALSYSYGVQLCKKQKKLVS